MRFRGLLGCTVASVACCGSPSVAAAAPGDLDPSFNGTGKQTLDFGGTDRATHLALMPDGGIAVVGSTDATGGGDIAVARLRSDGTRDTSFNGIGRETLGSPGVNDVGGGVVALPDGKIVVASFTTPGNAFFVRRLLPDGSVDTSFAAAHGGIASIDWGASATVDNMALQPDGKLVLVGGAGATSHFAIARLNADGTPDTTFNGSGKQVVDFGGPDEAFGVALQPDGKIVVAGKGKGGKMVVTRLTSDGQIDPAFAPSSSGKVFVPFAGNANVANAVALQPDGGIVLAGATDSVGSGDFAVARLTANGSLDTTFNGSGMRTLGYAAPNEQALAVVVQQNGRIVVMGQGDVNHDFALTRLARDGSTDTSFGTQGSVGVDFGGFEYDGDLVLQPDGNLVLAGSTNVHDGGDFAVARLIGDPVIVTTTTTTGTTTSSTTTSTTMTTTTTTPPAPSAHNVEPPSIQQLSGNSLFSAPDYRCRPGQWDGLAADPSFTYAWIEVRPDPFAFGPPDERLVAGGPTYHLPDAKRGESFYCDVSALGADGARQYAQSRLTVLTGVSVPDVPDYAIYGNVKVRGIDIYETTQPIAGSQQFQWGPNYVGLCGGGTPTSYVAQSTVACSPPNLLAPGAQAARYQGVDLDPNQPATAVVYVSMDNAPASNANLPLTVKLSASIDGRALDGVIPLTITNPPVSTTPYVTLAERTSASGQVRFAVPAGWLTAAQQSPGGTLDLQAQVSVPVQGSAPLGIHTVECDLTQASAVQSCAADDTYTVQGVRVAKPLASLLVHSVALLDNGQTITTLSSPGAVLHGVTDLYPGGATMTVAPYAGSIDISGVTGRVGTDRANPDQVCTDLKLGTRSCRSAGIDSLVTQWIASSSNNRTEDLLVGVHRYPFDVGAADEPGWTPGGTQLGGGNQVSRIMVNDGSLNRPLTAAAHEFGHAMGAPHAGLNCGSNSNGQVGEAWAPDNNGLLQGIRFGVYPAGSTSGVRTRNIDADGAPVSLYDLMSYCASEATAWLSPFQWQRVAQRLENYAVQRGHAADTTASPAAGISGVVNGTAFVVGSLGASGAMIDRVVPEDPGNQVPASEPGSILQIDALDAGGHMIAQEGASLHMLRAVDRPASSPVATFTAPLPPGTASVIASLNGQTVAQRSRSRPPHVRLLAPRHGARVGGGRGARLEVRWNAGDPDNDPLQATVDFSTDGNGWRTLYQGPDRGSVKVPGGWLSRASHARVRVTVNDGFNQARAISSTFAADGVAPLARIAVPTAGQRLQAGVPLELVGQGIDDRGLRLGDTALTWFAGKRRLGHGRVLRTSLPAGTLELRLEARDRFGRTATDTRRLNVAPAVLIVTRWGIPVHINAGARALKIVVATSVPATLETAGRAFQVDSRARSITVQVPRKPKVGLLKIQVRITAHGVHQPSIGATLIVLRA